MLESDAIEADASRRALEAGLVFQRSSPLNCETPLSVLNQGDLVPNRHFYIRNHFPIPRIDLESWRLQVNGVVERPLRLRLSDLLAMPAETRQVTLECAGNGRSMMSPPPPGEQWGLGAVSTATWTGVPLVELLHRSGIRSGALEVVFRGADAGMEPEVGQPIRFERSLEVDQAKSADALLAYAMNGDPLAVEHGYPLRLIVPGWYGVASVKWLTEIEVIGIPFRGYFQTDRYQYEWPGAGDLKREPVTLQRTRSLITEPRPNQDLTRGEHRVRGLAWSGAAPIAYVDVSVGGGPWSRAELLGDAQQHRWRRWEFSTKLREPGATTIRARAIDLAGRSQPERPEWNRLGYGSNAIQEVTVRVR